MSAILISEESGEIHILPNQDEFFIGRGTGACIDILNIDSDEISRKHAIIKSSQDRRAYHIEDNASKNGTFVNGRRAQRGEPLELVSGDRIGFSTLNYLFKIEADAEEHRVAIKKVTTGEFKDRKKRIIDCKRDEVSLFQIKMLQHNTERGFLKVDYLIIGETYRLYYDIEGHTELKQFMSAGYRSESDLYRILYNIVMAARNLDVLYIKPENLSLTADSIYINPLNLSIKLMFVPTPDRSLDVFDALRVLISEFQMDNKAEEVYDFSQMEDILKDGCYGLAALACILQEQEKRSRQLEMAEKRYLPVREIKDELKADSVKEAEEAMHPLKLIERLTIKQKGYISQAFLVIALIMLLFSGMLRIMDYIGFCIVVIGVDLWLLKSFRFI